MTEIKSNIAEKPLVTAILVCWNHERFVKAAILSALRQTYQNIQLIVFDNNSTDNSREVIESLSQEYHFQFIHQQNVGLIATLNHALGLAKGKYFTMLATDDIWLLDKVERQVAFMESHPDVALVCGAMVAINDKDEVIGIPPSQKKGLVAHDISFKRLMEQGNYVQGPTVLIRTEILRSVGGYDTSCRLEDYTMALKLTNLGKRVVYTGELCTLYRRHGGNWTSKPIYEELLEIGAQYKQSSEYPAFIRRHMKGYFRMLAGERKAEAIQFLRTMPIEWNWSDVGVGLIKLVFPVRFIKETGKRLGLVSK